SISSPPPQFHCESGSQNEFDRTALKCQPSSCSGDDYIRVAPIPDGRGERAMPLLPVSLDDKYDLGKSRVFVSGFQALVRLCLMQKERDRRAGLNTAGYVTGYRGSPLGTL